jgi:hypothetical protein
MSSRQLLVALGAALFGAGPAAAQDSAAAIQRMAVRLDSLQGIVARAESAQYRSSVSDTVLVGALRIATSAALRPAVEAAAAEAWDSLFARFGPSISTREPFPIEQFGSPRARIAGMPDPHEVARGFERSAANRFWREQDAVLVGWLRGSFPSGPLDEEELVGLSARLAVVPARPNPGCLAGVVSDCATALGLGVGPDTLAAWYDSTAWPGLAWGREAPDNWSKSGLRNLCSVGNYSACREVLPRGTIVAPVGASGRQLLVQLALETGGPGAFGRLTADPAAPLARRLEAAAGVPLDALLRRWIDVVRMAMPDGQRPNGAESAVTLAWCATLLLVALRGPQWR